MRGGEGEVGGSGILGQGLSWSGLGGGGESRTFWAEGVEILTESEGLPGAWAEGLSRSDEALASGHNGRRWRAWDRPLLEEFWECLSVTPQDA